MQILIFAINSSIFLSQINLNEENKAKSMQPKFELFDELPLELQIKTAQNLSNPDLVSFSMRSKDHFALFKPMVDVNKLLYHVARGNHEAVKAILKEDMSLIFKRGKVKDCSGRTFDNVSSFEYALWALDKHMWALMLACIPQNEEGQIVFAKLLIQYNKINTDGITYKLNGETVTEKHFDFENTIIKELQTQLDLLNAPGAKNWDAIDKQWREGLGSAQKLLPVHVVDEYCSNEPFSPIPKFTAQPKSSRQFYNSMTGKHENWFDLNSKLGSGFAIYKGASVAPNAEEYGHVARCCLWARVGDLPAIEALCEARAKDFINLKSQLDEHMAVDSQPQAHQIRPI